MKDNDKKLNNMLTLTGLRAESGKNLYNEVVTSLFKEGMYAYMIGTARSENPYSPDTIAYYAWHEGHVSAAVITEPVEEEDQG